MGITRRNDCNGCADCKHCGLDKDYEVAYCDECYQEVNCDDEERIYHYNNRDLCIGCLIEALKNDGIIEEVEVNQ